jgi:hypothetical protein
LVGRVTNWDYLLRLASRHAVSPLVWHVLVDTAGVPGPVLGKLRTASRGRTARSLRLSSGLVRLLDLFASNSIPAVSFRGPVLEAALYGSVALREFRDLDILIPRRDVVRAKNLLLAHGYLTDLPVDKRKEAVYLNARHELHFTPTDRAFLIELHQAFVAPYHSFPFDYDSLWARLRPARFFDRDILTLAPDDLLIVLCVHATKHAWARLGWLCDVARLLVVCKQEFDWHELMARASSLGARRMVSLGCFLAHHVLGAPVPSDVLRKAENDGSLRRLAATVETAFFDEAGVPNNLQRHVFFLQARERFRDKFHYCRRLAFTPTEEDHSIVKLPSLFGPLYYPLHAVRVARKYGLSALRGTLP